MGLDMYLSARKFISAYDKKNIGLDKKLKTIFKIPFRLKNVEFEVGYWRKANQIHKWFVDNIQEGEDNCKDFYVDREKLKILLSLCKEVLKDKKKAKNLLPVCEGFFFGNDEYDECYFNDLEDTIKIIEKIFKELNNEYELVYSASW